jgi:Xaa-Pro aminopeptidase
VLSEFRSVLGVDTPRSTMAGECERNDFGRSGSIGSVSDSDRSDASSAEPFRRRVEACQDALEAENADAVICFPGSNMTYLSGFAEEPMERHLLLFLTQKDAVFLVPELYAEQLAAESPVEDRRTWADGDDPRELIDSIAADLDIDGSGSRRILLDDRMWELSSRDVRRTLPGAEFGLASDILEALRIRKDEGELERLREVARIADSASVAVRELGNEAVGTTETELARGIESRLTAAGGEALSFEPVVGSSPNGARPHHRHGDREIEAGEPVVLDFGTLIGGCPSDQTRTVVFDGEPSGRFERTHEGSGTHSGRALRRSDRTSRPGPSMRPLAR